MKDVFFIGIDVGQKGGLAIISGDMKRYKVIRYPGDYIAAAAAVKDILRMVRGVDFIGMAVVEKASSRPGQGVKGVFTFGTGYGVWLGILAANEVPHVVIAPRTWQKAMLGAGTGETKNRSIQEAKAIFPRAKMDSAADDGKADALNMARYARQLYLVGKDG